MKNKKISERIRTFNIYYSLDNKPWLRLWISTFLTSVLIEVTITFFEIYKEKGNFLLLILVLFCTIAQVFWMDFLFKIAQIGATIEIEKNEMNLLLALIVSKDNSEQTEYLIIKNIILNAEFENQNLEMIINKINDFENIEWKAELLNLYWDKVNSKDKKPAKAIESKKKVKCDLDILNSDTELPENIEIASKRLLEQTLISKEVLEKIIKKNQDNSEIIDEALKRFSNLTNEKKLLR